MWPLHCIDAIARICLCSNSDLVDIDFNYFTYFLSPLPAFCSHFILSVSLNTERPW